MTEFGKIIVPESSVSCCVRNQRNFIQLVFSDVCPEGFKPILKDTDKPVPDKRNELWFTYQDVGDAIQKHYSLRRIHRTYSKLKLYVVLSKAGLWPRLSEWMETVVTDDGISAKLAFDMANEISDSHPLFDKFFSDAKTAIGIKDETADLLLDQCVM